MMAVEGFETPERHWSQDGAGDTVTATDVILPSPEPHCDDLSGDEDHAEEEHSAAIDEWLARTCPVAKEPDKGTSEAEEETSSGELLSEANPALASEDVCPDDPPSSSKPRPCATETADSIRAMRNVAVSSAHQAITLHSCQRLLHSAYRKLGLALLAVVASFLLQIGLTGAPKIALALCLVALMLGLRWTLQYLSITKELSGQYAAAFGAQEQ